MSFLNDIGDGFKEAGKFMVDKTNELSGKAKDSMEKSSLNDEVLRMFQDLGKDLYNAGGDTAKIPDLAARLEEIGKRVARINELEAKKKA